MLVEDRFSAVGSWVDPTQAGKPISSNGSGATNKEACPKTDMELHSQAVMEQWDKYSK